jgi:hypothetical protein
VFVSDLSNQGAPCFGQGFFATDVTFCRNWYQTGSRKVTTSSQSDEPSADFESIRVL